MSHGHFVPCMRGIGYIRRVVADPSAVMDKKAGDDVDSRFKERFRNNECRVVSTYTFTVPILFPML